MDERNFYVACCWTLMLAFGVHCLHLRVKGQQENIDQLQADVSWLKDNTVAHETEARP